eukprot:gnl/TRDRNA2_/TRDRNA2_41769_c0_seq1.p1 gnl/TRDRNA2_/TRDRNA2_41769_c0~~gnl/TRDRNA2_/TRDRNA2_41769_c0_seq1.p1  ORF type:complete len:183 (+),score=33.57 gnl/TRDRNA2_/TRDRNA2_41769_c0_seq1:159-707(+)
MEVVVRIGGRPCCYIWADAGLDVTARQLKEQVRDCLGIPREHQRVLYRGAEAWDDTRPLQLPGSRSTPQPTVDLDVCYKPRLPNFLARRGLSDLSATDQRGRNAFLQAAASGNKEVCMEIVFQAKPCAINAQDALGDTALHSIARQGCLGVGLALLSCKAFEKANAQNKEGYTALHTLMHGR